VRITADHRGLDQRHLVVPGLERRADLVGRLRAHRDGDIGRAQRGLQRGRHPGQVHRARLVGDEHRGPVTLRPAVGQQGPHRLTRAAQHRAALAAGPHAGRQKRRERNPAVVERDTDERRIQRGSHGMADLLAGERLLLGLEGQVTDPQARGRQRTGHPARGARRKPDVEGAGVELRFGVLVGGDLQEDDTLHPGCSPPVARHRLDGDAAGRRVDDPVGPAADKAGGPVLPGAGAGHGKAGVGEHREQRSVGLEQRELHRADIEGAHRLDHAGPAQQQRPPRHRSGVGRELALEAGGDLRRGQGAAVVKADTLAERECPDQSVAGDGPPGGQRWIDLGRALAVGHERIEHLPSDEGRGALERAAWVQDGGNTRDADAQFLSALGGTFCRPREGAKHQDTCPENRRHAHRHRYTWNRVSTPTVSRTKRRRRISVWNLLRREMDAMRWQWESARAIGR